MAEPDVSKIIELIMKNPQLISEIKELADKDKQEVTAVAKAEEPPDSPRESTQEKEPKNTEEYGTGDIGKKRRSELLRALKPYVSNERQKAIESMVSIADILDMMRG